MLAVWQKNFYFESFGILQKHLAIYKKMMYTISKEVLDAFDEQKAD